MRARRQNSCVSSHVSGRTKYLPSRRKNRLVMPAMLKRVSPKLPSTVAGVASCIARWCCDPRHASSSFAWHVPQAVVPTIPEPLGYRIKNKVLGPPLSTDRLEHETLGKPTALAVFASDNLSSSAYATEEILRVLIPYIGLAAFTLVAPVTIALLVVLFFLILSYRQTIKAYPSAGGAYIVTRDNFGLLPAQIAGVALLTDYILTVAVSVAAGSDAIASTITSLQPYTLEIALFFVALVTLGNLRGTKESGKMFAAPTYFFIGNMLLMLAVGVYRRNRFEMTPCGDSRSMNHPSRVPPPGIRSARTSRDDVTDSIQARMSSA